MTVAVDDAWALAIERMPDPHPFVHPDWQWAWWRHFGSGELELVPLGEAGVAALERVDGGLRFLGSRDVTDYPGPAIAPGTEPEAATLLVARLRSGEWL